MVGKIARLFRLKGHEFLFEAAPRIVAAVPNVKFLLVGDGVYRERFEWRVAKLGLRSHFVFAGLVPPQEIPRYVASMDVLVHLSLREGLPRALPQALACGKPVVAFDVDGAREVCLDGETGLLVRVGEVNGVAEWGDSVVAGRQTWRIKWVHGAGSWSRSGFRRREWCNNLTSCTGDCGRRGTDMHWLLIYFYVFDVSFVLALILTPGFKRISFQWKYVDEPDSERKIHTEAMPLLGGVAVFCAFRRQRDLQLSVHPAAWKPGGSAADRHAGREDVPGRRVFGLAEAAGDLLGGGLMVALGMYDDKYELRPRTKLVAQVVDRAVGGAGGNTGHGVHPQSIRQLPDDGAVDRDDHQRDELSR